MAESHDDPFPESALDEALEQAWGVKQREGESVVAHLERLPGVRSRVLLHEAPEEDAAPLLRVGAAEGPDRPEEDRRYHLLGEIARGGVGIVYRGRDRDLGRDVALKVLRTEHAENDVVVTRFVEEAQIGAQLQHPGVVPVYSLGLQPDGRPHFAMKLIKGRTLGALLAARRTPTEDRRRFLEIFLQACQTVSYAHAREVLHRDLKPANVMVGAFGEVLVVDWGFGKVLGREPHRAEQAEPEAPAAPKTVIATVRTGSEGSESIVGSVMGTPAYMPPEQALGHVEDLDARSDVFSLGAILLEILSGKPPYTGDARDVLIQAMRAHLDPAFGRLDACDADDALKDLARDCLHPVPGDRPTDAGVVATRLSDWMAAVDERAERAEVEAVEAAARLEREQARGAWERRARTRTRLGAAAAALAIVLGAGAFWLVDARRHARAEAARPAIEQALLEAARLEGRGELTDALAAAERARDLARTGGVSATLLDDATTRVTTLETALAAKRNEAARIADTQAFTAQLAEVLMDRWKDFNERDTDAEYRRMFAARGLDPLGDDPTRVAARIRELYPEVLVDVAAGLDGWASIRWKQEREDWPWASILACADAVDPEPLRTRIRAALAARDRGALRTLAEEHAEEDLPGPTVYLFGTALGRMYEEQGVKLRHALLQRRLLEHPDDFWVHAYLSFPRDPNVEDDIERALDHALAAAALRPTSARALCQAAERLRDLRRFEHALAYTREAQRLAREDAGVLVNHGAAAFDAKDLAEAERAWERATELDPRHVPALLNLAVVYERRGDPEKALDTRERVLEMDPRDVRARLAVAHSYGRLGRSEESVAMARRVVEERPRHADAWCTISGGLQQYQGPSAEMRQEAVTAAEKAVALAPRDAANHAVLASALMGVARAEEAMDEVRTALRLEPENDIAWGAKALIHERRYELEQALAASRRALALNPHLPRTATRLGSLLLNLGRYGEAEACLRELIGKHRDVRALLTLSQTLTAAGDLPGAQTILDDLSDAERSAYPAGSWFARAVLHDARDESEEAVEAFRMALHADPNWAPTWVRLASVLVRLRRYDEVIEACQKALALHPTGATWNMFGLGYLNTYRLAEAKEAFQAAVKDMPDGPDRGRSYLNLGLVASRSGEPEEALDYFEQAADIGGGDPAVVDAADRMIPRARRQVELLALMPQILDGSEALETAEDYVLAWGLCWSREDREAARRIHEQAIPFVRWPTAWLAQQAATCLLNCQVPSIHVPLADGEREAMQREALGLLQRVVAAVRDGVHDAEQAREWLVFIRDDERSATQVRAAEALAELPAETREAWTALWRAVDEVLGEGR